MIKALAFAFFLFIFFLPTGCSINGKLEESLPVEENLSAEKEAGKGITDEVNKNETEYGMSNGIDCDNVNDIDGFDGSGIVDRGLVNLQKGSLAPSFELEQLDGGIVSLEDHCGIPVILLFWEQDCHICLIALKALENIHRVDDVIEIYIVSQKVGDDITDYLREHDITIPLLIDRDGTVFEDYKIKATPTAVAIDRAGSIEIVISGFLNHESAKTLQRLLRKWVIDRVII